MGTDLLEGLDANPLPRSLIIEFRVDFLTSQNLGALAEELARLPGIAEIYYPQHWLEKTEDSRSLLFKVVLFLGIMVSLAIVLNLLHTTRLSIRAYYEELRQLRLLGADKTFLYFPYLFEGLFYALISSIAGWVIVFSLAGNLTFQNIVTILPERMEIMIFCAVAALIGVIVGYIGIRRVFR
jgi:cell division transport system permease protein